MANKRGHYVLLTKKGIFIFNTYLRRGRVLLNDGRAREITYKSHPEIVKKIILKGEHCASPYSFKKGGKA